MPECVESAALDPELLEKRVELSLDEQVCVPGCSVTSRKQEMQRIGPPFIETSCEMASEGRGQSERTYSVLALRRLYSATPYRLPHSHRTCLNIDILHSQAA